MEPRNRQHPMSNPAAPWMATSWVSQQKSAEGIVGHGTEGPNAEMRGGLR
jgi:hypothetical protein